MSAVYALGYDTHTLDGYFGNLTVSALKAFQRSNGLSADGICGCASWTRIVNAVVGIGRTPTVVDPTSWCTITLINMYPCWC